jgi:hypothetical protein
MGGIMSEEISNNLLIEEQKTAFEHLRFIEAKRDRFVIGGLTASGASIAFIAQIFSKDDFHIYTASGDFIAVLIILCFALCLLSWFLHKAYVSLSPVMKHYESVIELTRTVLLGEEGQQPFKVGTEEKPIIEWLDTRKNKEINKRSTSVSELSKNILFVSCWFWLLASLCIFFLFLFGLCQCCFS